MADIAAPAVNLPPSPAPMSAAELSKRGQIAQTAKDFESSFLSVMLGSMFKDVNISEPFGGGHGEDAFKSFMTEAMAKQVVKSGGLGISDDVAKEMLKLQGLS
ncbi:rod-binding protein [Phenylobacterium sp.]|uniref:rod-binding protein n=1 Tax=Phenylobacterium sp. TaxID=1871053 RepID=UPI0027159893|nr:rod-binding protein [Phenylobacterium sp.]MDO8381067.1 rod-binding protein [Phenylobacterium sp.]